MTNIYPLTVALLLTLLAPVLASAQDGDTDTTFTVTVEDKTEDHPFHNEGFPSGYAIDGSEGEELTLRRETTYEFIMEDVPSIHPFYISTSDVGGGAGIYTEGVTSTNNSHDDRAWNADTLFFSLSSNVPDTLYYQCTNHDRMGYRLVVTDATTTAVDEGSSPGELPNSFVLRGNYPNPFNPTTTINFDLPRSADVRVEIYTVLGQVVKTVRAGQMQAGTNRSLQVDGSGLASGTYLYRIIATVDQAAYMGVGKMVLSQ